MLEILPEWLIPVIFGWPTVIASLLVSLAGLMTKKAWLLIVGGFLAVPFTWYTSLYGGLCTLNFLLPFFQFGAAYAIRREKVRLAWLSLLPLTIILVALGFIVFVQ